MSAPLREAVARYLQGADSVEVDGSVRRITMDIEALGRTEMVTLSLRDGELQCASTDGDHDGPHVRAALAFIAGVDGRHDSQPPRVEGTARRTNPEAYPHHPLAEALDELLMAITRVGIDKARYAPSVDAALKRVIEAAGSPMAAGIGRFVGRLRQEVLSGRPRRAARILEGASQFAQALQGDAISRETEERVRAWLGAEGAGESARKLLSDRTMVEVGREWLSGNERAAVERRYLVDLDSGAIYREDRPRHATASLGPCPRLIHVGLAESEPGPAPERLRILQYEVRPEVPKASWDRLTQVARRSFAQLTEGYRRSVGAYPALAEPFALIAPYRSEHKDGFVAIDAEGHQVALERNERRGSVLAFYDRLHQGLEPIWIGGRLTDLGTALCISPFAAMDRAGTYVRL
ncbi:MAG: hypothetical protein AAF436_00205 [Myxococcota bacterium]